MTEILCWTQRDRIPYSFAICTILYSCIECTWEGFFSADPNKLLGCSAQVIEQDTANVLLGLCAVHGIFHCICSPDTFQTMVTEPSHPLAMQVKDHSHFPTGKRREDRSDFPQNCTAGQRQRQRQSQSLIQVLDNIASVWNMDIFWKVVLVSTLKENHLLVSDS